MAEAEFRRWYWTMAELQPFARRLGVAARGPKLDLVERIAARLAGREITEQTPVRSAGPQLRGPLDRATVIPPGQRSTSVLRAFFEAEIGPSFRFDGHMRAFLADGGATLGDAIAHWHTTRGTPMPNTPASLEFNAFTKEWHRQHPDGTADACRAAWQRYRNQPRDRRPPVADA